MSRALIASLLCLTAVQLVACGDDDDAADGGVRDSGVIDLGGSDLAVSDFGTPDLGTEDAGTEDDAATPSDGAISDGEIRDGGQDAAFDPASCVAQAALGEGTCDMSLGVMWNAAECVFVRGCTCTGAACDALFPSRDACLAAYSTCVLTRMCNDSTCTGAMSCIDCPGGAQCLAPDAGCVP